jgi:MoaA/NifB/PqqE/SkfB family radical SAM enzyme
MTRKKTESTRTQGDPVCLAPFVGLFHTPARMSPCCEMVVSDFDSVDDLWNSDLMKGLRKSFLTHDMSNLPTSCVNCLKSTTSHRDYYYLLDRPYYKETFERYRDTVSDDGSMTARPLAYYAIGSSNKCNYGCRICHVGISSTKLKYALEQDLVQPTDILPNSYDSKFEATVDGHIDVIKQHADTLREIVIHGGDPTQHVNLPELIDAIKEHIHEDAKICFLSNGSFRKCVDGELIWDKLAGFKNLHIVFSMDGLKDVNEYTRIGCNHDRLVKLIYEAKAALPSAYVGLHATITNMNILGMADFLKHVDNSFAKDGIWLSANVVNEPEQYHPRNLPTAVKSKVMKDLYSLQLEHWNLAEIREMAYMAMMPKTSQELWQKFLVETKKLDNYSDLKFSDVFPELAVYEVIL